MISPMPTMMRKPKNGISTGGRSSTGKVSSPISRAVQLPEAMKLPSLGISSAKRLRSLACIRPGDQHLRGRLLALPARLDRGELRRLVLEHVETGEVTEEQLHRDQHRRQPEAPVQHDARLRRGGPRAACTMRPVGARCTWRWSGTRPAACAASAPSCTGPSTIARQSAGMILPSTISWPTGTCIQELLARIQNEENIVPSDTMQQAKK